MNGRKTQDFKVKGHHTLLRGSGETRSFTKDLFPHLDNKTTGLNDL